uniref:Uncharacterized protein n=1 Tax=Oryza rufipogon TaxID=4529 RepID=A0A0E0P6I0_ORYRU
MRVVREHKLPPTSLIPGHWSPSAPSLSLLLHGKKERRKMTGGRRRRKKRKRKRKTDMWAPAQ